MISCANTDIFDGQRISNISTIYADSSVVETKVSYNENNQMITFSEKEIKPDKSIITLTQIDSVKHNNDTVIMYDNTNEHIFAYVCRKGYAINCYRESKNEGYISATFHYIGGYLVCIEEMRAVSFSYRPDTLYLATYDNDKNLIGFSNKYNHYTINTSDKINKANLVIPPVSLGVYAPAFYAGILGKQSKTTISTATLGGKTSVYEYTEKEKNILLDITDEKGKKNVSFLYSFK